MKVFSGVLAALGFLIWSHAASASPLYANDFELNANGFTGAGGLQGTQGYGGLGYGLQFLRNDSTGDPALASILNLNLANAANSAVLSLDLAIIDSWDGCCAPFGPDFFNVKLDGVMLFNQFFDSFGAPTLHPALVTKAWGGGLGFNSWNDGAYFLTLSLGNLGAGAHSIEFFASGGGWQGGFDESWGIDNVLVTGDVIAVPEPATLLLISAGLSGFAMRRRLRRRVSC